MTSAIYGPPLHYHLMPYFFNAGTPPYVEKRGAQVPEGDHLRLSVLANQLAITQLNQVVTQLLKIGEEGGAADQPPRMTSEMLEFQQKLLDNVIKGFSALDKTLRDLDSSRKQGEESAMLDALQNSVASQKTFLEDFGEGLLGNVSAFGHAVSELMPPYEGRISSLEKQLSELSSLVMGARADLFNMSLLMQENFDNLTREEPPPPAPRPCPAHYFDLEGECFFASAEGEELNWNQARKTCRLTDGDLAEPQQVLRLILALGNSTNGTGDVFWAGGHREQQPLSGGAGRSDAEEGDGATGSLDGWRWLSGAPVGHGWLLGRPSFDATRACLGVSSEGLSNENCNSNRRFVCELNMDG
ncbi:C-type lectin domain family 10 member A-like [Penaeus monodon]|uniref:C-type lectin domain family 10 member A-like n=1 Tax=Penaeus monodon TaxID=6687 RepID=UPI0018A79826|nr:C-type lectin domain family 10 member A-like [Penaeus monodon]